MSRSAPLSAPTMVFSVLMLVAMPALALQPGALRSRQLERAVGVGLRPVAVAPGVAAAKAGDLWESSFGLAADDDAVLLRRTSSGYVFGGSSGQPGGTSLRGLLFATDMSGAIQWGKDYSGVDMSSVTMLATPDGGYVISGTTSQGLSDQVFWLVKLDATGAIQWQNSYGTFSTGFATAFALDDGSFVISGLALSFVPTPTTTFRLLRLDSSGNITWQQEYQSQGLLFGSLAPLADGSFIAVGYRMSSDGSDTDGWAMKLTATGAVDWQRIYSGNDGESLLLALPTGDGGFILEGGILAAAQGGQQTEDSWLLKVDATGSIVWQKTYGGPADDLGFLQDTGDGGYLLAGSTKSFGAGDADVWLAKLDGSGDVTWSKAYGGTQEDGGFAMPDPTGGYLLVGFTRSFGAGEYDGWVAKLDATGEILWQRTYGGPQDDQINFGGRLSSLTPASALGYLPPGRAGLELVPAAKVAVDDLLFGGTTASYGAGGQDVWVAQLDADGQTSGSCSFIGEVRG